MCDIVFLNLVPNSKYWFPKINKGNRNTTVLLKQVLLPNIKMIKIDHNFKLTKKCNKRQAGNLAALELRMRTHMS